MTTEGVRLVARRPFTFRGHQLQPGDPVEGASARQLRQLIELNRVQPAEDEIEPHNGPTARANPRRGGRGRKREASQ